MLTSEAASAVAAAALPERASSVVPAPPSASASIRRREKRRFGDRPRLEHRPVTVDRLEQPLGVHGAGPMLSVAVTPSSRSRAGRTPTCAAVIGLSTASGAATSPASVRTQEACRASTETIVAAAASVAGVRFVACPL